MQLRLQTLTTEAANIGILYNKQINRHLLRINVLKDMRKLRMQSSSFIESLRTTHSTHVIEARKEGSITWLRKKSLDLDSQDRSTDRE